VSVCLSVCFQRQAEAERWRKNLKMKWVNPEGREEADPYRKEQVYRGQGLDL
jgi:hypothetical protein